MNFGVFDLSNRGASCHALDIFGKLLVSEKGCIDLV
jgi:hypothetical protein